MTLPANFWHSLIAGCLHDKSCSEESERSAIEYFENTRLHNGQAGEPHIERIGNELEVVVHHVVWFETVLG